MKVQFASVSLFAASPERRTLMSARSRSVRCWLIVSATVVALAGAATPLAADDGTLNKAAWALLPVELMDLRDPQTALAFALRATELTDHKILRTWIRSHWRAT